MAAKNPVSLIFAIPDHPWTDAVDGASVRIAMTVATNGSATGQIFTVCDEKKLDDGTYEVLFVENHGRIGADIRTGPEVSLAESLAANMGLCGQGIKLVGSGFLLTENLYSDALNPSTGFPVIRHFVSPSDVMNASDGRSVIDFSGLSEIEARDSYPEAFQIVLDNVKPIRDQNKRKSKKSLIYSI